MIATALLLLASAAPPAEARPDPARCDTTMAYARADDHPRVRRLTDEPPANLEVAVVNRVDGCEKPIVVRYDVGGQSRR